MKLSNLSFILTDDCNFRCSYCFQTKDKKYMNPASVEKAARFFYPYLDSKSSIIFFGGEPLLSFDNIQHAVALFSQLNQVENKEISYYLTTNGSLVTPAILHYFDQHKFDLMLSFDGFSQESARHPDSLDSCRRLIEAVKNYPGIHFSTNSVFDHETVSTLSDSLQSIIEAGVTELLLSLSSIQPWSEAQLHTLEEQLEKLTAYMLDYYRQHRIIPVTAFQPRVKSGRFVCVAGHNRMNIDPEEGLWGCHLFYDLLKERKESDDFKGYSFGKLDDFILHHETIYPKVMEYYADLRQERFFTEEKFCFICKDVDTCSTCPVNAAYNTDMIGKIPLLLCRQNKIQHRVKQKFLKNLEQMT